MTDSRTIEPAGFREFLPNIYLIRECIRRPPDTRFEKEQLFRDWYLPGKEVHSAQSAFLILDERNLLFETLTPGGEDFILQTLEELLDGQDLDYLVISHPEANHAGNTHTILKEHPETQLVVPKSGAGHGLFNVDENATHVEAKDSIDLGTHTVEFLDPVIYDHAMHTWMMELETKTLFTVDWMGNHHLGDECLDFVDEIASPITRSRLQRHVAVAIAWLRFADPDRLIDDIEALLVEHDPRLIAPTHGLLIRENIEEYVSKATEAIRVIAEVEAPDYGVHTHGMSRYNVEEVQ